jgi:hypothetical protein
LMGTPISLTPCFCCLNPPKKTNIVVIFPISHHTDDYGGFMKWRIPQII